MEMLFLLKNLYRDPLALSRFSQFRCLHISKGEIIQNLYLQPIINQYFVNNKSEIWLWSLMIHSKGHRFNGFINS